MKTKRIILTAALAFAALFVGESRESTCEARGGAEFIGLFIGVDYDGGSQYSGRDAKRLAAVWRGIGGRARVLTTDGGEKPTRENILRGLREVSASDDVSCVFILFSGVVDEFDGETYSKWNRYRRKISGMVDEIDGETYFAPSDFRFDESGKPVKETLIAASEIRKLLEEQLKGRLGKTNVFVLTDGRLNLCDLAGANSSWELQMCSPGERSWEINNVGSPAAAAFVEALSEGKDENGAPILRGDLDGDGVVTCLETCIYVRRRTQEISDEHKLPRQTPRLVGRGFDFPLAVLPGKKEDEKAEKPADESR